MATNLKWIMSSNSVCLMRRPRFETWFMEGTLEPWVHYVPLNDNFTDLEEKMDYCLSNPAHIREIIDNANCFVEQFRDKRKEKILSLLVLQRYFYLSGQIPISALPSDFRS